MPFCRNLTNPVEMCNNLAFTLPTIVFTVGLITVFTKAP